MLRKNPVIESQYVDIKMARAVIAAWFRLN
jgi:hypothetical protein